LVVGGGVIINISSIAGKPGVAYFGESLSYSISKAALNTFSENLAAMLAPRIRVVSISPGYTLTPMWNLTSDKEKKDYENQVPLKRFVMPEEIAQMVISVSENEAITGTNIVIDAGLTLREIK
jgi:NAD(P)-dependent dehydrogenase (short-subunit alcohol dehydrogenase family)